MNNMQMIPITYMTPYGPMMTMVPFQTYQYMMRQQVPAPIPAPVQVPITVPAPKQSQKTKLPDFIITSGHDKVRIAKGPPSVLDGENFKARKSKY